MALTDFQNWWTWEVFRQNLQNDANKLDNVLRQLSNHLEYLDLMTGGDLDAMGVPAGAQTISAQWRTALGELKTFSEGTAVTPTVTLNDIIDQIRPM